MQTRLKGKIVSSAKKVLLATKHPIVPPDFDPTCHTQASKFQHYHAMAQELDALANNNTWSLVPISEASNVVDLGFYIYTDIKYIL
jgi:hypothetical protein